MGPIEWITIADLSKRAYDAFAVGAPFPSEEVMAKHVEILRASIDLVPQIDSLPAEGLDSGITSLLTYLALIMKAYRKEPAVRVNANYMVPRAPTVELRNRAHFTRSDKDPAAFQCFLTLEQWADPDGACPHITLPVERPESIDPVLFGAPKAFMYKTTQVIGDTLDMTEQLAEHETHKIRQQVVEFFASQRERLRSFVSIPVAAPKTRAHTCPYPTMAVVNIDSNRKHLFGKYAPNQRKLGLILEPVVYVLAHLVVQKHFRPELFHAV